MQRVSLLECRNAVDVLEFELLTVLGFNHLVECCVKFLACLSRLCVISVGVRVRLHVDAFWILKEYFHKEGIDLFGCHLFNCCNFLLDSVEIVQVHLDLVPIR